MFTASAATAATAATLRGLDWRFLLAGGDEPFEQLVWLGATAELAQRALDLGIAGSVTRTLPPAGTADALVLSPGADVPVSRAGGCLRPGGAWYSEVGQGVQNAGSAMLQSPVQVYWTPGGAMGPSAYLPLVSGFPAAFLDRRRGPAAWYARRPAEPLELRARLRGLAAGWFPQAVLERVPFVAPERALVASPHAVPGRLSSLFGDARLRWALLTPGTRDTSSVVFLPFAPARSEPLHVVKTLRTPDCRPRLEREQRLLLEMRSALTDRVRRSIPEPLGLEQIGSLTLGMQSYCAGRSLAASSGDWAATTQRKLADLQLAAEWLTELHQQTQLGSTSWTTESIERWIAEPIRRFQMRFGTRVGERRLFAAARRHAERLSGTPLLLVRQHNDFDPWNVHRLGDRLGVFDWERSALGPALLDLLYFVTIWSSLAHRLSNREAQARDFEQLYLHPVAGDPLVRAARRTIAAYLGRLQIDPGFLPLALVMMVVERALDRVDGESTTGTDPRSGNRHVRYLEVLTRQPARVFPDSEPDSELGPSSALRVTAR